MTLEPRNPIDEEVRRKFERSWIKHEPVAIEDLIPDAHATNHSETIFELVLVEMEYLRRPHDHNVKPTPIEEYVTRFPALADPISIAELIQHEFQLRGETVSADEQASYIDDYQERFPKVFSRVTIGSRSFASELRAMIRHDSLHTMSRSPGQRIGRYELINPHGLGGYGEVWRVRDSRLGREVALKQIRDDLLDSPEYRRQFVNEAFA